MHFPHLEYRCIIGCIDKWHLLQYLYLDHSLRCQLCLHFPAAIEFGTFANSGEIEWAECNGRSKNPKDLSVILQSMLNHSDIGNGLYTREVFWECFFCFGLVWVFCLFFADKKSNLKTQWDKLAVTFFDIVIGFIS